jgi:hypothetical protein
MISNKYFESLDGTTKTFLADFVIKSEQYCRVYNYKYDPNGVDGEVDSTTGLYIRTNNAPASDDQLNLDDWALVNNIVSFYTAPPANSTLVIEVATTPEELGEAVAGSAVLQAQDARDLALQYAGEAEGYRNTVVAKEALMNPHYTAIDAVYANEANINAVNTNETNINIVAGIADDVTAVAAIDTDVTALVNNETNINTVVSNLTEILAADDNAAIATTKAGEASTSATNAAASETAAASSATSASSSATSASSSATSAASSATSATSSASSASTSATNAASSASAASTSESNAASSATAAASSATSAGSSATAAAASASTASTAATNAAAAYDSFDDRYLGPKSSAPTTDNDGDPLITGAMYFDTTENLMYVRGNTGWQEAAAIDTTIITYNSADGGFANSTYTAAQSIDGGNANG